MSELVAQVKDEQSYIVVRERIHRNTAESTNARIKWWSIFQLMVLTGQGFFQVWWLKRFFEVSRGNRGWRRGNRLTAVLGQARRVRYSIGLFHCGKVFCASCMTWLADPRAFGTCHVAYWASKRVLWSM
jgi:hypothetical protein